MTAVSVRADRAVDDADLFLQHDRAELAEPAQRKDERGADGRVTRERKLGARREDAHARGAAEAIRLEYEHGLGIAELARDRLHRFGFELIGVEHHGQRIARKALLA